MSHHDPSDPRALESSASGDLERGRAAYERRAFGEAFRILSAADRRGPLQAEDLDLLAMSAGLLGRDADLLALLERAHHAHLEAGSGLRAARSAFWLGFRLINRGEPARASGWFARAQRLIDDSQQRLRREGLPAAAARPAAHGRGQRRSGRGRRRGRCTARRPIRRRRPGGVCAQPGGPVAAAPGPRRAGARAAGRDDGRGDDRRAVAAAHGPGLLHGDRQLPAGLRVRARAGVDGSPRRLVRGARDRRVRQPLPRPPGRDPAVERRVAGGHRRSAPRLGAPRGRRRADHRRGVLPAGRDPSPAGRVRGGGRCLQEREPFGLGPAARPGAAAPGAGAHRHGRGRRSAAPSTGPAGRLERTRLLPACVEILLADGQLEPARAACDELEAISGSFPTDVLAAMAAHARGAVELEAGDARGAHRAPAPGRRDLAARRGALPRRAGARPGRAGLPRSRGRGGRGNGARRRARRVRKAGGRARRSPASPRSPGKRRRLDRTA